MRNANTGREYTLTDRIRSTIAQWEYLRDDEHATDDDERDCINDMYELLSEVLYGPASAS